MERIRILSTKSRLCRCYAVTQRLITPDRLRRISERSYYPDSIETLEQGTDDFLLPQAQSAIKELLQINGITWILVRAFEINVKIEHAFDWSDVHDAVIKIIKEHVFTNIEVEVQDLTRKKKTEATA